MNLVILPTMGQFANNGVPGFPHLFSREDGSFSHWDLEEMIEAAMQPNGDIDWAQVQSQTALFTNPLGEGTFDPGKRVKGQHSGYTPPGERIVNAGWWVLTFEYDGDTRDDLEMQLDWFAGKPENSPFNQVHRALSEYADYRGYSAVFSGNKSLHIHVLFDLTHLSKALRAGPNSAAKKLWNADVPDEALRLLHRDVWGRVAGIINTALGTDVQFDTRLQSYVQKRRMPWGIRTFTKASDLHGFQKGDEIEQIVVQEHIVKRAIPSPEPKSIITSDDIARDLLPLESALRG